MFIKLLIHEKHLQMLSAIFLRRLIMKLKLLNTTNERFKYLEGTEAEGHLDLAFYFGTLKTSYVVSIHKTGPELLVKTKNSTYTFEVLDGSEINDFLLPKDKQLDYEHVDNSNPHMFMVRA
jgi:hypothetical protein